MKSSKLIIVLFLLIGGLLPGCIKKKPVIDLSKYDFQDGDILLQHIPSYLCSVIADVSQSQYSHCGIIVKKGSRTFVLEAIGPVRYTPISRWISRGVQNRFTQIRPINLSRDQIQLAILEAEKMLGRPYDLRYDMDEQKIYCSELIYKAYQRGCQIEIGEQETLGSLNWKPHEQFIRHLEGGGLPLNRVMVTPESLTHDTDIKIIFSTFPPSSDTPLFARDRLTGTWTGDYTIRGLTKATATLTFSQGGVFSQGTIRRSREQMVRINSFKLISFSKGRNFSARLTDSRGITATISAQLRGRGDSLIGTWKDNRGYEGIFSFRKIQ